MISTKHWYLFDEVVSSLQKSIRRGLNDQAIFWAGELYNSGHEYFLFKKLFTIAIEDIGLAVPDLLLYIYTLYKNWMDTDGSDPTLCLKVVKLLVNAKKSRLIADLLIYLTSLRKPPELKLCLNQNFDKFSKKYPSVSSYIIEMVKHETKGNINNDTDIFSALIQFVIALVKGDSNNFENACFFAHLLNLLPLKKDHRHEIVGQLVGKTSDLNANKCSVIIWGILSNKQFLKELGIKLNKTHIKLLKRLYVLNARGLGNSAYNLLFAIGIIFHCTGDKKDYWYKSGITIDSKTIDAVNQLTPDEIKLFQNNDPDRQDQTIFERRRFSIPEYALDLSTKRGRGLNPKKIKQSISAASRSTEYYLLNGIELVPPNDCIVPPIEKWPLQEIAKSHGKYKNYSGAGIVSHIRFQQIEGNQITNSDTELSQLGDKYKNIATKILLDIESRKNYTFTKYTKLVKYISTDAIQHQTKWLVLPNFYLQANPLKFDGTLVHDTHLYEHELFYDIHRFSGGTKLYSAKICYPDGFCPLPVMVYGPITESSELKYFKYINDLKKILIGMQPVNYHVLKVYPTLNYHAETIDPNNEYNFIIMEQPTPNLKALENISYHFTDFKITKSYIMIILFDQLIRGLQFDNQAFSEHTIFYTQEHNLISFGPEIQPFTLQWLSSEGIISDLINEYKYEFLYILKEWYQSLKASEQLSEIIKIIYKTIVH
jgi:hypothetical protein